MIIVEIKLPEKDAEMILKVISKLGGKVKLISLMFLNFRLPQKKWKKIWMRLSGKWSFTRKVKFNWKRYPKF